MLKNYVNDATIRGAIVAGLSTVLSHYAHLDYSGFIILILSMSLDIIIAILFAFSNGEFRSYNMKVGLSSKITLLLLVVGLTGFEYLLTSVGIEVPFSGFVVVWLCTMELLSIFETFAKNGVILPKGITKWFEQQKHELFDLDKEDKDNK